MKTISSVLKYLFLVLGILVTVNIVIVSVYHGFSPISFLILLLGLFLFFCGLFWKPITQKTPKFLKITVPAGVITACVIICSFYLYGSIDTVTYEEDVIIVLGSGIRGETISKDLQNRLDTALILHEKNPSAIIVVSGGQGGGENITEALAMERYLIKNGVDTSLILKEERSTSTHENFLFTKELLDTHFDGSYTVAYVTSDFHIFRAGCLAHHAGFTNITHAHGNTTFYTIIPSGLRECLAIVKMILLDLPA